MKKLILLFPLMAMLFSCAPEITINRKIDGTWNLVSINGQTLPNNQSQKVTFKPDRRNGQVTYTYTNNGVSIDSTGTYSLMKYEYITTSFVDNSKLGYKETVYTFTKCTETELLLTEKKSPSNVYYYKKVN